MKERLFDRRSEARLARADEGILRPPMIVLGGAITEAGEPFLCEVRLRRPLFCARDSCFLIDPG